MLLFCNYLKEKEIKGGKEKGVEIKEIELAIDGILVIVNKENPLLNLMQNELKDIFTGKVKDWSNYKIDQGDIKVFIREDNSGTYAFFKEHIIMENNSNSKEEYSNSAISLHSNQAIVEEVKKNKNAIGYIGMGYINDEVKALTIDGIEANFDNIKYGVYPISRKLYWYYDEKEGNKLQSIKNFLKTKEVRDIVKKEGFVPIN